MDKKVLGIGFIVLLALVLAVIFALGGGDTKKNDTQEKGQITRENSWIKGSKDAKVQIVEFSDFQCPACGMAQPEVKKVLENYGDKVALTYRHFPLAQHKEASNAAKAAEAAGAQGKFWEMHDLIFQNQSKLSAEIFPKFADDLKLDAVKFKSDFESQAVLDRIATDKKDAETLGVSSTPTFYLNGEKVEGGGLTFEDWKKLIDNKL